MRIVPNKDAMPTRFPRTLAYLLLASSLICSPVAVRRSYADSAILVSNVRKIYIEKMADNLDQFLASSISKKFHGAVTIVLEPKDADAILRGVNIGAQSTSSATVQLVDPGGHQVIWSGTAGDRKMVTLGLEHGHQQQLAESLVAQLKKAMQR